MKTFYGIADAHGIESFIPESDAQLTMLMLRANFNRQRHACFYKADCTGALSKAIQNLISKGEYVAALHTLKLGANISIPENQHNSWDLIPNPKLDPWA